MLDPDPDSTELGSLEPAVRSDRSRSRSRDRADGFPDLKSKLRAWEFEDEPLSQNEAQTKGDSVPNSEQPAELKKEESSDSDEDEPGRWTHVLSNTKAPLPKKMPRPAQQAQPKQTSPTPPPPPPPSNFVKPSRSMLAGSSGSSPSIDGRQHSRQRSKAQLPGGPMPGGPMPDSFALVPCGPPLGMGCATMGGSSSSSQPANRLPTHTSTGIRPSPPPSSSFTEGYTPLPGPPPLEDPPFFALLSPANISPNMLALPAPGTGTSVAGNRQLALTNSVSLGDNITLDIDEEAASVGDLLNGVMSSGAKTDMDEIMRALEVIRTKVGDVLGASGGASGPVKIDLHLGPRERAALSSATGGVLQASNGAACGSAGSSPTLPPSLAVERVVDVSDIRFSQRSMKRRFQDGRHLEELIRGLQLKDPRCNPMTADFLKLTVVEKLDSRGQRALYSKDNRRLWCLKEYQRRESGRPVPVRVKILPWMDVVDAMKFSRNYDTQTDGREIFIRE
eukprot:TRINITY_DN484_c0_g1_i1.p1 TRINITY_DN484_c0_g1~~TRINITY_DN484_c0_g1_i1.p1  ORF type:complete len:519 (+),score=78.69 TRINITY_DN484_c0_g1_i1:45-1559(+)